MAIKAILFDTEMVRAILEGRKSCTRRIVKPQQLIGMLPDKCKNGAPEKFLKEKKLMFKPYCDMTDIELINTAYKAPYQPGDILYVRETWKKAPNGYYYYEDWQRNDIADVTKWKPSVRMPKEAARIWLKVTNVRVERLQEMNPVDVIKEGAYPDCWDCLNTYGESGSQCCYGTEEQCSQCDEVMMEWENLWNSTIKKSDLDSYGWNASPWVWVIEFEMCEKPEGV
jgi:hypothetical protein|nr:MAG TPA: ASCH domain protein [Caudoviricetes sp.]